MIEVGQFAVGKYYTDNKSKRLNKSINLEDDLLTYIENSDGGMCYNDVVLRISRIGVSVRGGQN